MPQEEPLSIGEARAVARILFDCSQGPLYLTKKDFENIAIQVNPEAAPEVTDWSREAYLNETLRALPLRSTAEFIAGAVKAFQGNLQNAVEIQLTSEARAASWRNKIRATLSRVNKVLEAHQLSVSEDGHVAEGSPYVHMNAMRDYVYDGLGRWGLVDVRRLLENAEEHFSEAGSNPLRYDDCASNAARALEGTLRKALVLAHLARGHPDPSPKLKTMMGPAIKELDQLGFWPDRALREAVDNYREFLRNKAQHYDTADLKITLRGFDRATAFFALWEAIALVGTFIHLFDRLQLPAMGNVLEERGGARKPE